MGGAPVTVKGEAESCVEIEVTSHVAAPVFDKESVFETVLPSGTGPKERVLGANVIWQSMPAPVSSMICAEQLGHGRSGTLADAGPTTAAENATSKVSVAAGASVTLELGA